MCFIGVNWWKLLKSKENEISHVPIKQRGNFFSLKHLSVSYFSAPNLVSEWKLNFFSTAGKKKFCHNFFFITKGIFSLVFPGTGNEKKFITMFFDNGVETFVLIFFYGGSGKTNFFLRSNLFFPRFSFFFLRGPVLA